MNAKKMWNLLALILLALACASASAVRKQTRDITSRSKIDSTIYHIWDCTVAQDKEIIDAIDHARLLVRPAIDELEKTEGPVSKTFEVLFGTSDFLRRRVLDVLQKVSRYDAVRDKEPYPGATQRPQFYCANSPGSPRKAFGGKSGATLCSEKEHGETVTVAMYFTHKTSIVLCDPFWSRSEPAEWAWTSDWQYEDICPDVTVMNQWGNRAKRITNTRKSTILHELIHYYLPCGGRDYIWRQMTKLLRQPEEVYTLTDCVDASEGLRVRKPENYCFYAAMTQQNCTELVDPYEWPFKRKNKWLQDGPADEAAAEIQSASLHDSRLNGTLDASCEGGDDSSIISDPYLPFIETANGVMNIAPGLTGPRNDSVVEVN